MTKPNPYTDELRRVKSLLVVSTLQKRVDLHALEMIRQFEQKLTWKPLSSLLMEHEAWKYAVTAKRHDPKLVFCHPDILLAYPATSLYYRGLCGLLGSRASGVGARNCCSTPRLVFPGRKTADLNNQSALPLPSTAVAAAVCVTFSTKCLDLRPRQKLRA